MSSQLKSNHPHTLNKQDILQASDTDYMNDDQLAFFRNALIELHETTLERIKEAKNEMTRSHDHSDLSDQASWEEQSAILLRIVDREQKLLPKIKQSLERIRLGEYGYCLESGEPIGVQRLMARPTAEYCAEVKKQKELKEGHFKGWPKRP